MIRVTNLLKRVSTSDGELEIVMGIDLYIPAGATAAIVGPSGSGKSTLLGLLAGMDVVSEGEIWLGGENISLLNEDERARRIGRVAGGEREHDARLA